MDKIDKMTISTHEFMRVRRQGRAYDGVKKQMKANHIKLAKWFAKVAWRLDEYERVAFYEILEREQKELGKL